MYTTTKKKKKKKKKKKYCEYVVQYTSYPPYIFHVWVQAKQNQAYIISQSYQHVW